jgi:hypothetical protein
MDSNSQSELRNHYMSRAEKGVILSLPDLKKFAKKSGLSFDREWASKLRSTHKQLARHSKWNKPPVFVGSSVDKLGNIMLDMAVFMPRLSVHNSGCKYFLMGVDCFSQKIACIPSTKNNQKIWERGVVLMKEKYFPFVTTVITDRDTSVAGKAFQNAIREAYGITWIHLRSRNKAYKSERMIRFMKERLSTALSLNKDKSWIRHIDEIVDDYNARPITGTDIARSKASKQNYMKILVQKFKFKNPTVRFNTSVSGNFSKKLGDLLFKFKLGQRVLLALSADYTSSKGTFSKRSVTGAFGSKIYKIYDRFLKSNAKLFVCPVYKLSGLEGHFYESELTPATFQDEETIRRETEREAAKAADAAAAAAVAYHKGNGVRGKSSRRPRRPVKREEGFRSEKNNLGPLGALGSKKAPPSSSSADRVASQGGGGGIRPEDFALSSSGGETTLEQSDQSTEEGKRSRRGPVSSRTRSGKRQK